MGEEAGDEEFKRRESGQDKSGSRLNQDGFFPNDWWNSVNDSNGKCCDCNC